MRAYGQYRSYQTDLLKNAFLLSLYDQNQVSPHPWSSLILGSLLPALERSFEGLHLIIANLTSGNDANYLYPY